MPTDNDESHERKLVTILAADFAGYSRLMADDDVATMRTLSERDEDLEGARYWEDSKRRPTRSP